MSMEQEIAKLLINSLLGKNAQRATKETILPDASEIVLKKKNSNTESITNA